MQRETEGTSELAFLDRMARATSRRSFLKWSGVTIAVAAVGCDDDDGMTGPPMPGEVNLGTGDTAVLNYAYALEQLEAAFYIRVTDDFYTGVTAEERTVLEDIRDHEIVHRDFFAAALGGAAIAALEVDFSSVDFSNRASVLGTARTFEDLGVSAYNGAAKLISTPANLAAAGKIVSVEARHASRIRSLLQPGTRFFAGDDVVDPQSGLGVVREPAQVLSAADPFVVNEIDASGLPSA